MNTRIDVIILAAVFAGIVVPPTQAQTLTSRMSRLNYNYVYGAGGDSHTGNDLVEDPILIATDTESTQFNDSTSGMLGESPYTAGAACDLDQTYTITGPFNAFESITASGEVEASSFATGPGVALMQCVNPGNELLFHFSVATSVHYELTGNFNHPNPGVFHGVLLQRFNGFTWDSLYSTFFQPNGAFNASGIMTPGEYRMHAFIGVSTFANETFSTSYNYTLTIRRSADMNCDGLINGRDVSAFVTALLDAPAYEAQFPECERLNGDANFDDVVTAADIAPFAQCVLNGGCQ